MLKGLLYNKTTNSILRNILKPFAKIIPDNMKFPVNGTFLVKGNGIEPFKMVTNPTNAITKYLFWGGVEGFEFNSVNIFCELVKDSKIFFDIGSNLGYYSLLASSIKKKNIVIYAFEPVPFIYDYLLKNISLNNFSNILPQKLALADGKGKATFYSVVNRKFNNMPQLTGDGSLSGTAQNKNSTRINFDVDIDTLDAFAAENLGQDKIDLMKLDTEANEHKVLAGAQHVLGVHRPIIQCEILKNQIETEIETILKNFNYDYYRATDKGLAQVNSFLNNNTPFVDYYLVPQEKRALITRFLVKSSA